MHVGDFLFFRMLQISVIQLVADQSRASQSSRQDCCCGFVLAVALIAGLQDCRQSFFRSCQLCVCGRAVPNILFVFYSAPNSGKMHYSYSAEFFPWIHEALGVA